MATTPAPAPTPPAPPAPPVPPTPPVRRRSARRFSAALFWAVVGALAMLFVANLAGYGPAVVKHEKVRVVLPPQKAAQPARPAPRPALKKPVASPTVPAPAPPAVAPQPTPQPVVTPPATPETVINVYPPALPTPQVGTPTSPSASVGATPMPVPRPQAVQPGVTLQLNIFANSWGGGTYHGYGSTYGWTPGHVARVCEERSTGPVCFDRWIPH